MTRHITHAIIPTAGFGTRMLPLSKAVPKNCYHGNRPAIAYVIDEAIKAGIKTIVLVNHAQKSAIENYFDINSELDTQLRSKGKDKLADSLNFCPMMCGLSVFVKANLWGLDTLSCRGERWWATTPLPSCSLMWC